MGKDQLKLYRALSRTPFPKSYVGKVFLSAFLGTHVPLLALLVHLVRRRRFAVGGALRTLSVTVPATVGGTALTLWAMYALSAPTALVFPRPEALSGDAANSRSCPYTTRIAPGGLWRMCSTRSSVCTPP